MKLFRSALPWHVRSKLSWHLALPTLEDFYASGAADHTFVRQINCQLGWRFFDLAQWHPVATQATSVQDGLAPVGFMVHSKPLPTVDLGSREGSAHRSSTRFVRLSGPECPSNTILRTPLIVNASEPDQDNMDAKSQPIIEPASAAPCQTFVVSAAIVADLDAATSFSGYLFSVRLGFHWARVPIVPAKTIT